MVKQGTIGSNRAGLSKNMQYTYSLRTFLKPREQAVSRNVCEVKQFHRFDHLWLTTVVKDGRY